MEKIKNISEQQKLLLGKLKDTDPALTFYWDEKRGVANSIRGKLFGKEEKKKEFSPKEMLANFLQKYGVLFGAPDISFESFKVLQQKRDDLEWNHLILQYMFKRAREDIEVYGAKLTAHFDSQGVLVEVQSSLWRDIRVDSEVRINPEKLRQLILKKIEGIKGFVQLCDSLGKKEEYFPLTDLPRLVIYPWKGGFPLAWTAYGYGVLEEQRKSQLTKDAKITFGQFFVNATTGEQMLFAPTLMAAETDDTGSGSAVTPITGTRSVRTLNIVRVNTSSTYRLKDNTHNRQIVTYDAACSTSYNSDSEIETAIKNSTLPLSEDTDGDKNWNGLPTDTTSAQRTSGQPPEVDAHFFADLQYEWYDTLSGGRDGWDAGNYPNPPVPSQVINVVAHCYPPPAWLGNCSLVNCYKWSRKSNGVWTYWLGFMDGDGITYDYPTGSHFLFAHEYQHAITDFSFEDGAGNPGLIYSGWLGAVHEGLSDTFAGLSSEQWRPGVDISHSTPAQVFRNIVYPRDTVALDSNKLDHFADRNSTTDYYSRGTILAHCAYLMGKGGVHQRNSRNPTLIPVYSLGRQNVGGRSFLKASRIWYRALSQYFSTHGALTGIPANDENAFRTLRNGCVNAAIDIYGNGSAEHRNTVLAFYAVGLHPQGESYGADVTFLRWGISWDLSRNYVGLNSPDYSSLDLFINNGGISEWNALINIVEPLTNHPTNYENTIYCRVRNVGDKAATNIQVQFEYAKAGTAPVTWLPVKDKNGVAQTLNVGTLNAGNSNFPDSDQNSPPSLASVKWCIPPLAAGELVDHFCLRAKVSSSNDVNTYNNEVQSNIAYSAYKPPLKAKLVFTVGNPYREKKIPIKLTLKSTLPKGWKAHIAEDFGEAQLRPREERLFAVEIKMLSGADARLEPPLNGDLRGKIHGNKSLSGPFTGSLTYTILRGDRLKGQFSANLIYSKTPSWPGTKFRPGTIVGMFTGIINLDTGKVSGTVDGSYQIGKGIYYAKVKIEACLRPWRRVDINQWHNGEILGGVTIQVQVPWKNDPCTIKLPKTDTKVITRHI